jgi:hypothetical protein
MSVRRLRSTLSLVAVCIATTSAATATASVRETRATSDGARRLCTLVGPLERLRHGDKAVFVGTATGDTVLAGAGSVQYVIARGHSGSGADRPIYGQVVRVDRLERATPASLRDAIAAAGGSVVLVPWDYDASCTEVPWAPSVRWMRPGASGVLFARLRNRAHWVDKRPTFDVTPDVALYEPAVYARADSWDAVLSSEELLSLYERLPDYVAMAASPDSAVAPVVRWEQENPELAGKPLAREIIDYVLFEAAEQRYKTRPSPFTGTYRVVYRIASGDSVAFFARTERHPDFINWSSSVAAADSGPYRGRQVVGHGLTAQAAATVGELPTRAAAYGRGKSLQGGIEVLDAPLASSADSAVFKGEIELDWAAELLAPDTTTRLAIAAATKQQRDAGYEEFERSGTGYLGRFVVTSAGRLYFYMLLKRGSVSVLTIQAERISPAYMKPADP